MAVAPPPSRATAERARAASRSAESDAATAPTEAPELDPILLETEAATPVPDAPPKINMTGAAALVWVPDDKARFAVKSVLIEAAGRGARVVATRKEPVLVGQRELWVLRKKRLTSRACAECELCNSDPPACKKNSLVDIEEPFLQSLGSKKTLEPWSGEYTPMDGCQSGVGDHEIELTLHGGVGRFYFFSVSTSLQFCGGAHPTYGDSTITLDVDSSQKVTLSFPAEVQGALAKRAHAELAPGCVMDAHEKPEPYRALAAYAANGELTGLFDYTMSAPYACGTGPGHYSVVSEQSSAWIPPELAAYGKLPAWVASYAAAAGAKYAFMVSAARLGAVKRELKR